MRNPIPRMRLRREAGHRRGKSREAAGTRLRSRGDVLAQLALRVEEGSQSAMAILRVARRVQVFMGQVNSQPRFET
jgi:hypothetical protein